MLPEEKQKLLDYIKTAIDVETDIETQKICIQLFRHTFGQRSYQYPFIFFYTYLNFFQQIIYLV